MPRGAVNSSALHVFDVLRLISRTDEPLGVSEISRRLRLPASTVYRALTTLEETGYLNRHRNMPRFELGQMPQLLNRSLVHRFRVHAASRPLLRALADETGETATLTVSLGWYGVRLGGTYGSHDIYHRDRLGEVTLLHENVGGLAILSCFSGPEVASYLKFARARGATPDDGQILSDLKSAQKAGVALAEGVGLALPVRAPSGDVVAALSISTAEPLAADNPSWSEARDKLEEHIASDPGAYQSPFAHLSRDDIVLSLERSGD